MLRRLADEVGFEKVLNKALILAYFIFMCSVSCSSQQLPENEYDDANRRLAKFDRENPDCQLWTNWQKMCSRTGENGETWCATDPDHPVEPSEPFCVRPYAENLSENQRTSSLRFCSEVVKVNLAAGPEKVFKRCKTYLKNRPFNGRRLGARLNPKCTKWINEETDKIVCAEAGDLTGALSACQMVGKENTRFESGLYCAPELKPQHCFDMSRNERRQWIFEQYAAGDSVGYRNDPEIYAVIGFYCEGAN